MALCKILYLFNLIFNLSLCLVHQFNCFLSINILIYLFIHLSILLTINHISFYLSFYLNLSNIYPSICISIFYLSIQAQFLGGRRGRRSYLSIYFIYIVHVLKYCSLISELCFQPYIFSRYNRFLSIVNLFLYYEILFRKFRNILLFGLHFFL